MIILRKKRLITMILILLISFGALSINISKDRLKTIETSAVPVLNKVVIVDAGHGLPDGGAVSSNGVTESEINLQIAFKLKNLLEQGGNKVILTRSDENGIYDANSNTIREKKISDVRKRVEIGNNSGADIFVSIHLNKIEQSKYYGWQTFYKTGSEKSQLLAEKIQESLNNAIQRENHREPAKLNSVYIMKHIEIPICIIECGFLSNPEEEKLLQTDEYQEKLAWGIYNGISDYFM